MGIVVWGVGTPRTLRVHWMLRELGLDYATRAIRSRTGETQTPEFGELNPRRKIPVLQDGDLTLTESAAIVTYLGETYGAGGGLVPAAGSPARARYDEACFYVMTELDAHSLYVIRKHTAPLDALYGEAPNAVRTARAGFVAQLAGAESALDRRPFIAGHAFTGADILLASCLTWARYYGLELPQRAAAYADRVTARDAYRAAVAHNDPTP